MLHWHTPIEGLGARLTAIDMRDLTATGSIPPGITLNSSSSSYFTVVPSVIYERGPLTLVTEALFTNGSSEINFTNASGTPVAPPLVQEDRTCGAYVSGSWHFSGDVDSTVSVERLWSDARDLNQPNTTRFSLAARWGITEHWSVKAEYQHMVGPGAALAADNPDGVSDHWDLFALKTTVDF